jgi:L-asparaginase II
MKRGMTDGTVRVEIVRKGIVEATHLVHALALDESGRSIAAFGDSELVTYWRSTAKPLQAMAVVLTGAADAFGLTQKELAIAAVHMPEVPSTSPSFGKCWRSGARRIALAMRRP